MVTLGHVTVCYGIHAYYSNRKKETYLHWLAFTVTAVLLGVLEYRHRSFLSGTQVELGTADVIEIGS